MEKPNENSTLANMSLDISPDGQYAMLTFEQFSCFRTQILIPQAIIVAFLKQWKEQEKRNEDIQRVALNERNVKVYGR